MKWIKRDFSAQFVLTFDWLKTISQKSDQIGTEQN